MHLRSSLANLHFLLSPLFAVVASVSVAAAAAVVALHPDRRRTTGPISSTCPCSSSCDTTHEFALVFVSPVEELVLWLLPQSLVQLVYLV